MNKPSDRTLAFIGTYTLGRDSEGIYTLYYDGDTGALSHLATTGDIVNPTFLAVDPSHRYLYSVGIRDENEDEPSGGIFAYAIDSESGTLTPINSRSSGGRGPCHVIVDDSGKYVLAANYGSGSVIVYPIQDDGGLDKPSDFVQHEGSSVHQTRQTGPHAHSVNLSPDNRFLLVADLGMDKLLVYRFDNQSGKLTPNDPPAVDAQPGAGPRHVAFHPSGRYVFLINEINSTLTSYAYDPQDGTLEEKHTLSTLPDDGQTNNTCADVHVSPSGRFVYGSNRGHNSIAIFSFDQATGKLTPKGHEPTQGSIPRNFTIDPDGPYLLVANQDGDNIVTFHLDEETGMLDYAEQTVSVPAPVCVRLVSFAAV